MFRTWRIMGALEDVLLVHGPGPVLEASVEMPAALAAWRVDDWLGDPTIRHTLLEIGQRIGLHQTPIDEGAALRELLRRAIYQGALRVFRVRAALSGGGGQVPPQPPGPGPAPPKPVVNPVITPAKLVVVVAKTAKDPKTGKVEPYTHPRRQPVKLSTDAAFDGTGTFTCDKPALIKFWSAAKDGVEVKLDGKDNVWKPGAPPAWAKGSTLAGGVTVFAEGQKPSGGMDDIKLELELAGGSKTNGPKDTSTATSVELTLDICTPKPGGGDSPPFSQDDKIHVGRNVLVQDAAHHFGRAQVIIRKVKPEAFKGELVLTAKNGSVTAFRDEKPKPAAAGEVALLPYTIATDKIAGDGDKLWAQGLAASKDMRDTGFVLALKGVEDEGDRVAATAVQIVLDLCQSRTKKDVDPTPLSADDKVKVGRFVHEQDANKHHGRALLLVRKIKPEKFDGTLVIESVGAGTELYPNERPTGGEAVTAAPHAIDYKKEKNEDKKLWVQGKSVSGALRDAGYSLHLEGDDKASADKVVVTVCKLSHLKADIPSTAAITSRLGNSPVNRHTYERPDSPDVFDEDSTKNLPFALVEGSVLATDDAHKILFTVQVAPAGTKILWSVQRDTRPAPDGDHATIAALPKASRPVPAADPLKARMIADGVGTFHVRPFVDCNGSGDFDHHIDLEPYILMNVVLIRVKGHTNISVAQPANPTARVTGGGGGVPSSAGGVGVSTGSFAPPGTGAAVHNKATVTVIGGGDDGRRGLDQLFGGWVNNETTVATSTVGGEDVVATYLQTFPPIVAPPAAPVPVPPVSHFRTSIWVSAGAGTVFVPGGAAPALLTGPVLDTTNFGNEGLGGNTCVGTEGAIGPPTPIAKTNLAVGQRWTIEMWDSPGDSAPPAHGGFPGVLVGYRFNLDFRSDLVFWTNTTKLPARSASDPANRLYSTVQTNTWRIRLALSFNPTTGVAIGVVPPNASVTLTRDGNAKRLATPVETAGTETRAPISLRLLATDART